jgi:hypothetical protein
MVSLDSQILEKVDEIRKHLSNIARCSPSLIIEEGKLFIRVPFAIPVKGMAEALLEERQKIFDELLRVVSIDYLLSGRASRIIIEIEEERKDIGELLIEFSPIHRILKT